MQLNANGASFLRSDFRDLLVSESVRPKFNDLAILLGHSLNLIPDSYQAFLIIQRLADWRIAFAGLIDVIRLESFHPLVLSQIVDDSVAAHGKQPGFQLRFRLSGRLLTQFQERILNRIGRQIGVSVQHPDGVSRQMPFMGTKGREHIIALQFAGKLHVFSAG